MKVIINCGKSGILKSKQVVSLAKRISNKFFQCPKSSPPASTCRQFATGRLQNKTYIVYQISIDKHNHKLFAPLTFVTYALVNLNDYMEEEQRLEFSNACLSWYAGNHRLIIFVTLKYNIRELEIPTCSTLCFFLVFSSFGS